MAVSIVSQVRERAGAYRRIGREPLILAVALPVSLALGVCIVLPLAKVAAASVLNEGALDGSMYVRLLTEPAYLRIIANTLQLGALSALGGSVLGFVYAYALVRCRLPWPRLFHFMALLPMISPPFIVALATIFLFGRRGLVTYGVFGVSYDVYGLQGLVFTQVLTFFPVSYLVFDGLLRALDPSLEEAALNLGASRLRIFRTVTLPLVAPGWAGSILLLFVESVADLGNPLVLGGNFTVLASKTYMVITGLYDLQMGAAISVVLLAPALIIFMVQKRWMGQKSFVSVTGRPTGGGLTAMEPWVRYPLIAVCVVTCLLIVAIYGTMVAGGFVQLWGINYTPTLEHYRFVLEGIGLKAMVDTTLLALVATPIAALVGIAIAFLVVRRPSRASAAMDFTSMLGMAVPGTVIGIGYILSFNQPPIYITGTAAILVIVFAVRSMPVAVRAGVASLQQIDPAIEEASTNLGANQLYTFRHITAPLVRPAVLAGMIGSFTRHMTSLSAVIFLVSADWRIMTAQILQEVDAGRQGNAAAYSTVLVAIVVTAILLLYLALWRTGARSGVELRGASS